MLGARPRQRGQSMVEFTVVVVFFCLTLTSDPALDAIQNLMDTFKERHQHYSYTVSLSDYPDTTLLSEFKNRLRDELQAQGYSNQEIEAIIKEKAGLPMTQYTDMVEQFTGKSLPNVGDLPEMSFNALKDGNPAELFQ